jgi:hypothetical protein
VERNFLDYFLEPCTTETPCWEATTVKRYMEQAQGAPWIRFDGRQNNMQNDRQYPDSLSVDQLYACLREPYLQPDDSPNTYRRLISIRNLDADTIRTLAETALWHQWDCLKDAFWKHISFETSIRIGQSIDGYATPHIEMHLPYLVLRSVSTTPSMDAGNYNTPGTEWEDVTFLNDNTFGRDLIYQAHISIVICIWNRSTWTGYRFSNQHPIKTDESLGDKDDGSEGDEEDGEDDLPKEDIFVPDGFDEFMSDRAIWDPRMYFSHVAAIWISFVLREYIHVIRTLEERVKAKVSVIKSLSCSTFFDC